MTSRDYVIHQKDGTQVPLKDVQKAGLKLLKYFDTFCTEQGISYTLCGGCCIGALRHGGFIPWDDDVDVHMLRKDYEKFYRLWNEKAHPENLKLVRTTKDKFCDTMLMQISNQSTTFIKENQQHLDIDHGLKLEMIPLDGAPESGMKRKIQLFWALVFYLFNRGFPPENRGKAANLIGRIALFIFRGKKIRGKIWSYAEKKMTRYPVEESPYVTELFVTWKYMKIRYPRAIFMGERRVPFDDGDYPIPLLAEKYLSMAFGDYMSLPPEEEQVPKHETVYIDLEKPYEEYRGIYYMKTQ